MDDGIQIAAENLEKELLRYKWFLGIGISWNGKNLRVQVDKSASSQEISIIPPRYGEYKVNIDKIEAPRFHNNKLDDWGL